MIDITYTKNHVVSAGTRKKISDSKIGDKNPMKRLDVRSKKSKSSKGMVAWNKGKTGIYSEESLRSNSLKHIGKTAWNKGKCGTPGSFKKGHKFSDDVLDKMSRSLKGRSVWNKGIPCSEEVKQKLSDSLCGRVAWNKGVYGERNSNWRGGISFEPYCTKFNNMLKERIRDRDGRVCQLCGCSEVDNGKRLDVHHIHYDKPNCDPDLITLCRCCNSKVNFNRDYFEDLFIKQLIERGII